MLTFLIIFIAGLALNLTPCVYPLIPITVAYFGGQRRGDTKYTILLATCYLLGLALTYSSLGLFASLTGSLFGSFLQKPAVLIIVALIIGVMGFSMLGLYNFHLPSKLINLGSSSKRGLLGATLMGLTMGFVAAPCIGPFIVAFLTMVAKLANPVLGFFMFFTLALGLGIPLVILAVSSGSMSKLPKAGIWMVLVKKVFGFTLIGMAVFFLRPLVEEQVWRISFSLFVMAAVIYFLFFERSYQIDRTFRMIKSILLVSLLALVGYYSLSFRAKQTQELFLPYSSDLLEKARNEARPVMIDFSASWCIPCRKFDLEVFSDLRIIEKLQDIVTLKADLTNEVDESAKKTMSDHRILGVPTIVFLDNRGEELQEFRLVEFLETEEFLDHLVKFINRTNR